MDQLTYSVWLQDSVELRAVWREVHDIHIVLHVSLLRELSKSSHCEFSAHPLMMLWNGGNGSCRSPNWSPELNTCPTSAFGEYSSVLKVYFGFLFLLKHSLLRPHKHANVQPFSVNPFTKVHHHPYVHPCGHTSFLKMCDSPHFISLLLIYLTSPPICPTATSVTSTSVTWALTLAFEVFFCYHLSSEVRLVS